MAYELTTINYLPPFINTMEFSKDAIRYQKTGFYTDAPIGTFDYTEYWDEQKKRCLEGYTVGGVRVTGLHYFYMNFCQIKMRITEEGSKIDRKRLFFPRFLDMDYYYFHELESAREVGQGMIVAKARRKGYSYKNAAFVVHQYLFYRDSTSIIGAYLDEYAQSTMDMVLEMVNFINKNTAWAKRKSPDKNDHIHARFKETVDGRETWAGYNSEIYTLTFRDNFSAAIGKSADIFLFEEGGKWPNLLSSYMITAPVFRDGDIMTGMPVIYGTGGDMDGGSNDFADMFYSPQKYWLRPFDNIWDEGSKGTPCGYFVGDVWYKPGKVLLEDGTSVEMVDNNGNSNRDAANLFLDREVESVRSTDSRRTYEKYISQQCRTPREAFLRTSSNLFPVADLNRHLAKLETTASYRDLEMTGDLELLENGTVKFNLGKNLHKPITSFPLKDGEDPVGCIVIWEHPFRDDAGDIPYGLYIAGTDPYDQDTSTTNSLGSTFIYKTFQRFDRTYNFIVAEYTGRPERAEIYYETVRRLLIYYNAKTLYENNLKGLKVYFEQKKSLHLLKEQPQILKDIVTKSNTNRGHGIHMVETIKRQAEIFGRDWLIESRNNDNPGSTETMNLDTIYSKALVQELIGYNITGNFDRVIAFLLVILHIQENHKILVEESYRKAHSDVLTKTKQTFFTKGTRLNSFR